MLAFGREVIEVAEPGGTAPFEPGTKGRPQYPIRPETQLGDPSELKEEMHVVGANPGQGYSPKSVMLKSEQVLLPLHFAATEAEASRFAHWFVTFRGVQVSLGKATEPSLFGKQTSGLAQ